MNPGQWKPLPMALLIGWMITACNFPAPSTRIASPSAMQVYRLHDSSLENILPARIISLSTPGIETATPLQATQGSISGCQILYHEDFEGPTVNMGEISFAQPPTPEWFVDDLSAISKPPGLPDACSQGSYCAGTNLVDVYDDDAEDMLYTPEIDFSGVVPVSAVLSFDLAYDLETGYDGMRIMMTPDSGTTWYYAVPDGGYPADEIAAFDNAPGYSGKTDGWELTVVDLGPMIDFSKVWMIAFEFASDFTIGKAGVAIDDIEVAINCAATPTFSPTTTPTFSPTRTPTILKIVPKTEVPPPVNTPTICPPTHKCK